MVCIKRLAGSHGHFLVIAILAHRICINIIIFNRFLLEKKPVQPSKNCCGVEVLIVVNVLLHEEKVQKIFTDLCYFFTLPIFPNPIQ